MRRLAERLYSKDTGRVHRVRDRAGPINNPGPSNHCVGLLWNWSAMPSTRSLYWAYRHMQTGH